MRRQAVALAARHGYTIKEFVGDQPAALHAASKKLGSRRKPSKVAPKYRAPNDKRTTWSGRGLMPRWLAQKTKHGRSISDFLIPGLAKPTARKANSIGKRTLIKQG
ncbi:H-NS histone family protein [Lysobacter gummosus]|uniref:H-NS histone family protein n=1 Tax=Lysobacter gummosus TaxID=262324 RepID=A0ABY3XEM8_9GAMM|nr:H-NS histone family protein [Lysobacter gummosus]UNP29138.1 H-NS histone family protein [Lysobacter gummosus]